MREIKFRAWDKKNKIMRLWDYLLGINYTHQFALFEDENYIFQQYTGLKDKNGKEIYEGDIVKYNKELRKVVWYSKNARWSAQRLDESTTPKGLYHYNKISEVAGDIHQNPELIN